MISKVGQIMIYVNNQEETLEFWTEKVGFSLIADQDNGHGMRWIEIAPTKDFVSMPAGRVFKTKE